MSDGTRAHLQEFAGLLRKNGVRVSTSELIDAAAALAAIGLRDGERARAALAATLIKRREDLTTFDELYQLYFLRGSALHKAGRGDALAEALRDAGLTDEQIAALLERMLAEAGGLPALARAGLGLGAPEMATLVRAAGAEIELPRIRSPLQIGWFTYRLLEAMDVAGAGAQARALLERMVAEGLVDAAQLAALLAQLDERMGAARQAVRAWIDAELRRQDLDYMQDLAVRSLADKPLAAMTEQEVASLRHEVIRLARMLRARVRQQPHRRRRGRLDLRRTLRRSLATGGIPFTLRFKSREPHKPRLVVLCDISDSVRNVSRFMLQLVYTLQELFDRVSSFAFVADLGELTDLFRQHDIDRAIELAYGGAVCNVFANSNYGNVLRRFAERHLDRVTGRTTVIVIGDGRNNYHPSHASVLADIQRRAKQVVWLNPEPPAAWGFGDSAMREYQPHCDEVVVVHDLDSLRRVVDRLVM